MLKSPKFPFDDHQPFIARRVSNWVEDKLYFKFSNDTFPSVPPWVNQTATKKDIQAVHDFRRSDSNNSRVFILVTAMISACFWFHGVLFYAYLNLAHSETWFDPKHVRTYTKYITSGLPFSSILGILIGLLGIQVTLVIATSMREVRLSRTIYVWDENHIKLHNIQSRLGFILGALSGYFIPLTVHNSVAKLYSTPGTNPGLTMPLPFLIIFITAISLSLLQQQTPRTLADAWRYWEEYRQRLEASFSKYNHRWASPSGWRRWLGGSRVGTWGFRFGGLIMIVMSIVVFVANWGVSPNIWWRLVVFQILIYMWAFMWRYVNTIVLPNGRNRFENVLDSGAIGVSLILLGLFLAMISWTLLWISISIGTVLLTIQWLIFPVLTLIDQRSSTGGYSRISEAAENNLEQVKRHQYAIEKKFEDLRY